MTILLPRTSQHMRDDAWEFADGTTLIIRDGVLKGTLLDYGKPAQRIGNWEHGCALFVDMGARLPGTSAQSGAH